LNRQKTINTKEKKLYYVENLRILLSALVVIVHVSCTYGGPGGWSYMEKGAGIATILPLTILNATSQSFFMGMFFFFGAYFTQKSLARKGYLRFTKDRVIRLGIPLALTYFFISVFTVYLSWPVKHPEHADMSFSELLTSGWANGFGVTWFVLALGYFTAVFLLVSIFCPSVKSKSQKSLPEFSIVHIILGAVIIGVITFLVRIKYPLFKGSGMSWFPFDLGHFPQYIFLFALGIAAARYDSDEFISYSEARILKWFVVFMILVVFPLLFFLGNAHSNGIKAFAGRGNWHSLAYAVWEQVTGFSIIVALLGITKLKWNKQSKLSALLSKSSFAVYVLHPPILVGLSMLFINWEVMLLIKFLSLTPLALLLSFLAGITVKHIPVLKRIF